MRKQSYRKSSSVRTGVAAVEFAVVFPVVLLFIVGLFELASVYRAHSGIQTALLKGAREASILSSTHVNIEAEMEGALLLVGVNKPEIVINPAIVGPDTRDIEMTITIELVPENGFFFNRYFFGSMVRKLVYERI